jgi:hypothetical protein
LADVARLQVVIGADTKGLSSGIASSQKLLTGFQRQAAKYKDIALGADPKGLQSGLAAGERSLGAFTSLAQRASEAFAPTADVRQLVSGASQAEGAVGNYESAAKSAADTSVGFRSVLGSMGGTALIARGNVAALAGAGGLGDLALGFGAAAKQGLTLNQQMTQAKIAFTSMLGSGREADAFLRSLADFAKRTPFEFPELVTASQRMLAFGFAAKQVRPLLTAVGNTAAAMGRGSEGVDQITYSLGQMRAATRVQAG